MKNKIFTISSNTKYYFSGLESTACKHAIEILVRDIKKIFDVKACIVYSFEEADVIVKYSEADNIKNNEPEAFGYDFITSENKDKMIITGNDDLGIIYGLLYLSKEYFEISPFWYWMDQDIHKREKVDIPKLTFRSKNHAVRYRGWFVNDEVCLIGWTDVYPPPKKVWYPVFETILRCNGNMVLPGTDLPKEGIHYKLASEMGLWITQHHAEPLGAQFFLRAYPNLEPSYNKYPDLFEGLWKESIIKYRDNKVIWVLGYRGQGDCPFWENDPKYDTPESRGKAISEVIAKQYDILNKYVREPICVTYLYGEIMELYKDSYIEFPDGVIKICSDNGYGKMVSRRQGNCNPRIPSLPNKESKGLYGVYYHVTFHDLQASSHLTMLGVKPELLVDELSHFVDAPSNEFMLINSGNIKPHVYLLDMIKDLWIDGNIDINDHLMTFISTYFKSGNIQIVECMREYFNCTINYGSYEDDKAGEEYYHHPVRMMIKHWMSNQIQQPLETLNWSNQGNDFTKQVTDYMEKCSEGLTRWSQLLDRCEETMKLLNDKDQVLFRDYFIFQVILHKSGCEGAINVCQSYLSFIKNDLVVAFIYTTKAIKSYQKGVKWMRLVEHDQWENFYRADWLTNIQCTIYTIESLRRYIRVLGDGPDLFWWYKSLVIPKEERNIYLENTQRQVFSDDDLADMLSEIIK